MSNVNEALVREVVEQVLSRLGGNAGSSCSCSAKRHFGVFDDAKEACQAAEDAFQQLKEKGVAGRNAVIRIVKQLTTDKAEEWASRAISGGFD